MTKATFKIIKTEFVNPSCFQTLEQLQKELASNFFNHKRIHSTLGYYL
ncbi:hypothetical protein CCE97_14855 [Listeria monocytogenes]|nr:hypothetical protein [Listeria monocytogenes]